MRQVAPRFRGQSIINAMRLSAVSGLGTDQELRFQEGLDFLVVTKERI